MADVSILKTPSKFKGSFWSPRRGILILFKNILVKLVQTILILFRFIVLTRPSPMGVDREWYCKSFPNEWRNIFGIKNSKLLQDDLSQYFFLNF